MKIMCKYHPSRPALWNCPTCETNYCQSCVTARTHEYYGTKKVSHLCPKCNLLVESLGIGNTVVPFWNRLPKFFSYPLRPMPLAFLVALAAAKNFFSTPSFFNALIQLLVWAMVVKYAYAALKRTSQGKFDPPPVNSETICTDFLQVFKQFGIFLAMGGMFAFISKTAGIYIGVLFLCLVILSVPSMLIILVVTNRLSSAINPMMFVAMAWRMGWGYLLMYFLLIMQAGAPAAFARFGIEYLPAWAGHFIIDFTQSFFMIVSYNMMGYVILQYHREIGYHVDEEELFGKEVVEKDPERSIAEQVDLLIKDGKISDAIAVVKNATGGQITDTELSGRYYNLLKLDQRTAEMLEHARNYLDLLAEQDEKSQMAEIYAECLERDPDFTPRADAAFSIASWLNGKGDSVGAVQAYDRFIKKNPGHSLVPKAYFLAAQVFAEKLKKPKQASEILKSVIQKYPEHEIIPYLKGYAERIGRQTAAQGVEGAR